LAFIDRFDKTKFQIQKEFYLLSHTWIIYFIVRVALKDGGKTRMEITRKMKSPIWPLSSVFLLPESIFMSQIDQNGQSLKLEVLCM